MPIIVFINLVKRRTSEKDQEGLDIILCMSSRALEGNVWHEGLCSSEGNTSLCWVCRYCGGQARSCAGVHISVVELTSLAILPFHCLSNLINPTVDWLG